MQVQTFAIFAAAGPFALILGGSSYCWAGQVSYYHWSDATTPSCAIFFPGGSPPGFDEVCPFQIPRYASDECVKPVRPGDKPLCAPDATSIWKGKRDIVWFDKEIRIATPLRSNGGTILLVADTVVIEAPIDSRVYFDHGALSIEPGETYSANTPFPVQRSMELWLGKQSNALRSYELFYITSNHVWDPNLRAYRSGEAVLFPEMPHGITPRIHRHISNQPPLPGPHPVMRHGFYPFRLKPEAVQSGDIYIFANHIEYCATCSPNPPGFAGHRKLQPECDAVEELDRTLIDARGIDGSRGWLGGWGCEIPNDAGPESCPHFNDKLNQLYGPGSGGTPGRIVVRFVNPSDFAKESAGLTGRIGAIPGADRSGEQRAIPDFFHLPPAGLGDPSLASRCVFSELRASGGSPRAAARNNLNVAEVDSDAALVEIQQVLTELSGRGLYSYRDLIFGSVANPLVKDLAPSDQLEAYLLESILEAIGDLTVLAGSVKPAAGQKVVLSPILRNVTGNQFAYPGLTRNQVFIAAILARFSVSHGDGALRSLFEQMGGLYRVSKADAVGSVHWQTIVTSLSKIRADIQKLNVDVVDFHYNVYSMLSADQAARLLARVQELQRALEAAKKAAEDQNNPFYKIKDVLTKVGEIADYGKKAHTAAASGLYDKDFFANLGGVAGGIGDLIGILKKEKIDTRDIERLLSESTANYNAFLEEARQMKSSLITNKAKQLEDIKQLRVDQAARVIDDLLNYEHLMRQIVLTRLQQGSASQPTYLQYLSQVQSSFDYTSASPPLFPGIGTWNLDCVPGGKTVSMSLAPATAEDIHCVRTEPVASAFKLQLRSDSSDFATFPLFTQHPGETAGLNLRMQIPLPGTGLEYLPSEPR